MTLAAAEAEKDGDIPFRSDMFVGCQWGMVGVVQAVRVVEVEVLLSSYKR